MEEQKLSEHKKYTDQKAFTYIDLFAGAGGLSEGFVRAGYSTIAHVEIDEAACYTLKTRIAFHYLKKNGQSKVYEAYLKGGISRVQLYEHVPKQLLDSVINLPIGAKYNPKIYSSIDKLIPENGVDLIIGGPPCQAYSLVGRARSDNGMEGDERNYLYIPYAKFLERYNPKIFVFENVIGLKSAGNGRYLANMKSLFAKKGYDMMLYTVSAKDFNVLQNRRRVIIIGRRADLNFEFPELPDKIDKSRYKVADLLNDLPKLKDGEGKDKFQFYAGDTNNYLRRSNIRNGVKIVTQHVARPHIERDKEIYRIAVEKWNNSKEGLNYNDLPDYLKTHNNRTSFIDRFKVVKGDEPYSHTVVAHISRDGHYYIHPDIQQNRSLSVREAARIQSFPDDYYFEGVKEGSFRTAAFKQIGNAVPPLMAEIIAQRIKVLLRHD
ncbi:DNA (cytosine-5-)-methyltransferase [bacterium]|nr:DNA (cytosine-5-)-methyltransferase [bacterium]